VAVLNGSTLYFLHDDMLGTPQLATDSNQAVQWQASYDAFGQASVSGTVVQNLRLPGQYFDLESGFYHNGFRDYLPNLGRYIEPDPLGRLGSGNNLYAYVGDNPANLIDPLGLCPNNACAAALKAANRSAAAVARAKAAWDVLQAAANAHNIPTPLLAAIGVRESNFMNVQETLQGGGAGPGMGVYQLTDQPGVSAAQAFDLPFAANYAAGMLSSDMNYLSNAFSFTPAQLLQATAASYNFGTGNISGNPNTIDVGTAHGNYGSTVVGIMACFSNP
jgi:RHS repeat-associated protein